MEFFWKKAAKQKEDVQKGKDLLAHYRNLSQQILKEKEDRTRRQAELWAVGSLTDSLTSEYKGTSGKIAYLIKQELALKEHINILDIELYHCQYGQCEALEKLLKVNPLADIDAAVPVVDFAKGTVK